MTSTSHTHANEQMQWPITDIVDGPYRVGRFTLHLLSDGLMRLTGQSMFRTMDQVDDSPPPPLSQRPEGEKRHTGRTLVGLNALLIQDGQHIVLVDTGIGSKFEVAEGKSYAFERPRKLLQGLSSLGITSDQVTHVINSHLHFDHCGGNTHYDDDGLLVAAFPKAVYHISRGEFEYAKDPPPREKRDFPLENILPLLETGQLELWDHDGEVLPGISVRTTGGHTRDHAIIVVQDGGETACFLADLIPTASHLHPSLVMKYDLFPSEVKKMKRELLETAAREQWLLLFDHAPRIKAGHIRQEGTRFVFSGV